MKFELNNDTTNKSELRRKKWVMTPEQHKAICERNKGRGKDHPHWGFIKSKRVSKEAQKKWNEQRKKERINHD